MYIKHVRHFLSKQGKDFFPSYIQELNEMAKKSVPTFIKAFHGISECHSEQTQLVIFFENKEGLFSWLATEHHEMLLAKLKPYMLKDWQVEGFTIQ